MRTSVALALPEMVVLPRVPVSAFLATPLTTGAAAKRAWDGLIEGEFVDCLICDRALRPILAIDLFGPGIRVSPKAEVKRIALASTGMKLHRCHVDTTLTAADILAVLPTAHRPRAAPKPDCPEATELAA